MAHLNYFVFANQNVSCGQIPVDEFLFAKIKRKISTGRKRRIKLVVLRDSLCPQDRPFLRLFVRPYQADPVD